MGFKKGEGGRTLGSRNKRSVAFTDVLEKRNFCAASALIDCYQEAKKTYDNYGIIYEAITDAREKDQDESGTYRAPLEDNAYKYLKIAADIAKDLASYSFPKLKSIEQINDNPLLGMTPAQKLEAMKQAVRLLETQVAAAGGKDGASAPGQSHD